VDKELVNVIRQWADASPTDRKEIITWAVKRTAHMTEKQVEEAVPPQDSEKVFSIHVDAEYRVAYGEVRELLLSLARLNEAAIKLWGLN